MKKYIIILLLSIQGVFAQVQFEARVSKASIGINERLQVDFVMNEDGDNFNPPSFEGFKMAGGVSTSQNFLWVNGRKSFNKTYSFVLMPVKKGVLYIKSASIEINGQVFKTAAVKITVGNAIPQQQDPYSPYYNPQQQQQQAYVGKEGVHLVAEVSNSNPYLNEPITVVYKIYVNTRTAVDGWDQVSSPKYNNFWSQNIRNKEQPVRERGKFQGEDCVNMVLLKTVLYPQKSGKLEIEPLSMNVHVVVPTGEEDFIGRQIMKIADKRLSTGVKIINVKPLPEAGKPQDFSGAVGNFSFNVIPTKTQLKNGQSLDLKIAVTGKGNLKLFTLPKPVLPSSLEMYDPAHKENVTTAVTGMTGEISDTYTIIPQFKGNYPIQPMTFSYFDLTSKTYKTISSKEINIEVLDGPTASNTNAVGSTTSNKTKIASNAIFGFIKLKTSLSDIKTNDFLGSGLFYGLLFLPFLLIPIVMIVKKKKEAIDDDIVGNRIKLSNKLAKKYLSEAKKQIDNKEPFYIALEKAMHNFLKAKLHIETFEMSKDKISEILLSRNANPESVSSFIALTENCELARYAPSTSVTIQQDYDRAVAIISELEKQI